MQFEYTPPQTQLEELFGGYRCVNAFGPIEEGDDARFLTFLKALEVPPRTDVYIDSRGGLVDPAINIGRLIRDHWFSTHVGSYVLDSERGQPASELLKPRKFVPGVCLSAATLTYLGGRLRYLDGDSQFGVHQFSFRNPSPMDVSKSQILTSRIARYLIDMGIKPGFLELSSSVDSGAIKIVPRDELERLRVLTGGQTDVEWSICARHNYLYARGERDSLYGHHKMILLFERSAGFHVIAVIESQGRETELQQMPLVELVLGLNEGKAINVSERAKRQVSGIYTNISLPVSKREANELVNSDGFGLRLRWNDEAPVFLGISPMATKGGEEALQSFVHSLS